MKTYLILITSLTLFTEMTQAGIPHDQPSTNFIAQGTAPFNPWLDETYCSSAEYIAFQFAKDKCKPLSYQQVSEFNRLFKDKKCSVAAYFQCLQN